MCKTFIHGFCIACGHDCRINYSSHCDRCHIKPEDELTISARLRSRILPIVVSKETEKAIRELLLGEDKDESE